MMMALSGFLLLGLIFLQQFSFIYSLKGRGNFIRPCSFTNFACQKKVAAENTKSWSLPPAPVEGKPQPPLILLDVDGVINFIYKKHNHWPLESLRNEIVNGYSIAWATNVVEKLNYFSRSKLAEIRWLTTWNENAQEMLAPKLGLDAFELGRDPIENPYKTTAMLQWQRHDPTRKIIWLDDEVSSYMQSYAYEVERDEKEKSEKSSPEVLMFGGKMLFIEPDMFTGLTPDHLDTVEKFLTDTLSMDKIKKNNKKQLHM